MSDEIRTEPLNNACDEVWALIEAHSRFMNKTELDEFTERIHSRLYEASRAANAKNALSIQKCSFCQHPKGYHYDESIRGVTQLPCNFTWEEDGRPVSCLCYGWCETKEEAEALAKETPNES